MLFYRFSFALWCSALAMSAHAQPLPSQKPGVVPGQPAFVQRANISAVMGQPAFVQEAIISAVALSPDGKIIAVAGGTITRTKTEVVHKIILWDKAAGKRLRTLTGGQAFAGGKAREAAPERLVFSPDGKRLSDGRRVWNVATGATVGPVPTKNVPEWLKLVVPAQPGAGVVRKTSYPVAGDGKVHWAPYQGGAGYNNHLFFAAEADRSSLSMPKVKGKTWMVQSVTMSRSHGCEAWGIARCHKTTGAFAAWVADGYNVLLLRKNGKETLRLADKNAPIYRLTFSADGRYLAGYSDNDNKRLHVVDLVAKKTKFTTSLQPPESGSRFFILPKDRLMLLMYHGAAKVWDIATGKRLLYFSPRSIDAVYERMRYPVMLCGNDPVLQAVARRYYSGPPPFAVSRDGDVMVFPDRQRVRLWSIAKGEEIGCQPGHQVAVRELRFSPDGRRLMSATTDERCEWDTKTWRQTKREAIPFEHLVNYGTLAVSLLDKRFVFSPEYGYKYNPYIAASPRTETQLQVRHLTSGKILHTMPVPDLSRSSSVSSVTPIPPNTGDALMSTTGTRVAILAPRLKKKNVLCVYDIVHGKSLLEKSMPVFTYSELLAFSGKILIVRDGLNHLSAINVEDGKTLWQTPIWSGAGKNNVFYQMVVKAVFSPDGTVLALLPDHTTAVKNKPLPGHIFDAHTGQVLSKLIFRDTNTKTIRHVVFSPDNRRVAVVGVKQPFSAFLQVHETASGEELLTMTPSARATTEQAFFPVVETRTALAFSPDGKTLATGCADGRIQVWDIARPFHKRFPQKLSATELETHWATLQERDACQAVLTIRALVHAADDALPWLAKHVHAVTPASEATIKKLVADLDDKRFRTRQLAMQNLEAMQEVAVPVLQQALKQKLTLEAHLRIKAILQKTLSPTASPERLRQARVLEVLEKINSAESRSLLRSLASGSPVARLTIESRRSLRRVNTTE